MTKKSVFSYQIFFIDSAVPDDELRISAYPMYSQIPPFPSIGNRNDNNDN